jgi:hypothetical protein
VARLIGAGVADAPALIGGSESFRQLAPADPMPDTAISTGVDTGWNSGVGAIVDERRHAASGASTAGAGDQAR